MGIKWTVPKLLNEIAAIHVRLYRDQADDALYMLDQVVAREDPRYVKADKQYVKENCCACCGELATYHTDMGNPLCQKHFEIYESVYTEEEFMAEYGLDEITEG